MVRVDLHLHTSASFDCDIPPAAIARRCRALGLGPLFVTDHDTIEGALQLGAQDVEVIVGQEIATTDGEVIGLFLKEAVAGLLSAPEAADEIRRQGGLVYLGHPYDLSRRCLREETIERIADLIDIVEVFNGRSPKVANLKAEDLCATLGAIPGAGSDAHALREIGAVYVEMEAFDGAKDFLAKLGTATIVAGPSRWRMWAQAKWRATRA